MVLTICSLRTFLLLSLLPPKSLGHGSRRAAKPPPSLLGNGSELREISWGTEVHGAKIILGNGSALREISWGTEVHCAKLSWGTEVQYRNYPGERKCSARNYPGERKTTATRLRRSCRAKSRPPMACCALPRPSLISIHITLSSAARTVGE